LALTRPVLCLDLCFTLADLHQTDFSLRRCLRVSREEWEPLWSAGKVARWKGEPILSTLNKLAEGAEKLLSPERLAEVSMLRATSLAECMSTAAERFASLLVELREACSAMYVVSNADRQEADSFRSSPLAAYFDGAFLSCAMGLHKQEPGFFREVAEAVGKHNGEKFYCGDGADNELASAQSIQMTSVLVEEFPKRYWPQELPSLRADADVCIEALQDLRWVVTRNGRAERR